MLMEGYWFRSGSFQIEPGEDDSVNPGIYGRQLALWLKERLEDRGQAVLDVFPEDFGWCVRCQFKPFLLWVGCGSINDHESVGVFTSSDQVTWHCFAVAERPLLGRLFRRYDMAPAFSRLNQLLRDILESEPTIKLVEEP